MARDVITLRPVPAAESCAKVGDSGYAEIAFLQCRRYIALLRLAIGPEPDGARLRVRRSGIDFDPYIDVVVEYDDQNPVAFDYARRCERDAPTRWRKTKGPAAESAQTPEEPIRGDWRGAEHLGPIHSMGGNGHRRNADNGAVGMIRRGANRAKEQES
jgi:hypothetical protein